MTLARILCCAATAMLCAGQVPPMPMPNDYANSIKPRWLAKPVLQSRLVDGMESMTTWQVRNAGQAQGTVSLTADRKVEGASSIRLRSRTAGDKPIPNSRYFGSASALRVVGGEDWSASGRLSFWIYPDLPGFRVVSLLVIFHNEGAERVPDVYGKMGHNYLILDNHTWNHVVWEIANLPRDKVTGVEFQYRLQGNEPGAATEVTFDIDKLELERVQADHWEGWNVAPGRIAYSHSGYLPGARKSALASGLESRQFQVIDTATGRAVLTKPVRDVETRLGRFQVMDFSEISTPGTYSVRAGASGTRPFRIGSGVWTSSIWKAINFFYVERCGYAIPGVHDICHRDWMMTRGDRKIPINGGWHDAGDLSQSFGNTAEATYAMFHLAERLEGRGPDPALRKRLIEEAQWGLDWVMKASFHDGFRASFSTMDRWTNGIAGDFDDMAAQPRNSPAANFTAAATEAIAARVLRAIDPMIASYSLKQAVEDWNFALAGMSDSREAGLTLAAHGVQAGVDLWQATGDQQYADKAVEMARTVLASQRREFLPGLTYPLAGIFYTGPDKQRIFRFEHNSQESIPVAALVRLCEAFPNHPDWIEWYSSVVLYADYYQRAMAAFTEPYGMLPNSVYADDEYKGVRPGRGATPESYQAQVRNGVKVGENHYVRLFPVWFEFRGNHGTVLSQTKALSAAARLRSSLELAGLVGQQLEWVVGRNPFVQSTMWGEGHDYAPQYSAMSGDIVGSLPVGIQTRGDRDIPYWPTENCHNWKEVWVVPVSRWLWIMADLAGPALLEGSAAAPAAAAAPGQRADFQVSHTTGRDGAVTINAVVRGSGSHRLTIRADNLSLTGAERRLDLKPGASQTVTWQARLVSLDAPWVAVILADGDPAQRKEATGSTRTREPL